LEVFWSGREITCRYTLDIGKPDKIEQRQVKWTMWSNVNIWFESFLREFLLKEGFGDDIAVSPDEVQGDLLFGENQTENIVNLDKNAIILDNMAGNIGGCPSSFSFYNPFLQEAPKEAAFKNSY
jgi:hypothetical protein